MRYFVIGLGDSNIAVVFHNYMEKTFSVETNSDAFRKALDLAIQKKGSIGFIRNENKVLPYKLSLGNPIWLTEVLQILCESGSWKVVKVGDISSAAFSSDIVNKFLFQSLKELSL